MYTKTKETKNMIMMKPQIKIIINKLERNREFIMNDMNKQHVVMNDILYKQRKK